MANVKNCQNCGKEFTYKLPAKIFCCVECREAFYHKREKEKLLEGEEGVDYVICKWCGEPTPRIYGKHMKNYHPDKTSEDYKKEFPDEKMQCEKDRHAISKNSGKHMSQEKYRKMFSEMYKGEKNPSHSSKVSEQVRKERSPFSKEFYIKRGCTEEEAVKKASEFAKYAVKDRISNTQLEYYLRKGMSEEDAKKALHDHQSTFTLAKCIEKYGQEEGYRIWKERQDKWHKSYNTSKSGLNASVSTPQMELFEALQPHFDNELLGLKDEYALVDPKNKRTYRYDITNVFTKKIIEFNGTFWHCKPGLFDPDYYNGMVHETAQDIWDRDERKIEVARENGFDVLVVWEDEYKHDPESVTKKCIEFLK